jgi:hypothetical protein
MVRLCGTAWSILGNALCLVLPLWLFFTIYWKFSVALLEKLRKWRVIAVLALLYAPVVAAQTASNWTEQHPQTSPPARLNHAMAYDSAHGQVVLFGGQAYLNGAVLNDTWAWDGCLDLVLKGCLRGFSSNGDAGYLLSGVCDGAISSEEA